MPPAAKQSKPGPKGKSGKPKATKLPKLVTRAELAATLKLSPAAVSKAVERGAPVAESSGPGKPALYDVAAFRAWLESRAKPSRVADLATERAKLARVQREHLKLKLRVARGDLLPRAVVVAEGQGVLQAVKSRILSVPRQAVITGVIPREAELGLHALLKEALRELVKWRWQDPDAVEGAA
jgi:hypothetical protein